MQDVCHDEFYWPLGSDGLLEVGICWQSTQVVSLINNFCHEVFKEEYENLKHKEVEFIHVL